MRTERTKLFHNSSVASLYEFCVFYNALALRNEGGKKKRRSAAKVGGACTGCVKA